MIRRFTGQRPHQCAVVAGDPPQDHKRGVGRDDDGNKHLHDQLTDGRGIGGDTGDQLLGRVVLIKTQRQMHRLAPDHPAQIPVDPGCAQGGQNARHRADHQAQQPIKQIGQHHGPQPHAAGKQLRAVLCGADADIGDHKAGRDIGRQPKIGQPRFAQHGKKAAEAAVILAEDRAEIHIYSPPSRIASCPRLIPGREQDGGNGCYQGGAGSRVSRFHAAGVTRKAHKMLRNSVLPGAAGCGQSPRTPSLTIQPLRLDCSTVLPERDKSCRFCPRSGLFCPRFARRRTGQCQAYRYLAMTALTCSACIRLTWLSTRTPSL